MSACREVLDIAAFGSHGEHMGEMRCVETPPDRWPSPTDGEHHRQRRAKGQPRMRSAWKLAARELLPGRVARPAAPWSPTAAAGTGNDSRRRGAATAGPAGRVGLSESRRLLRGVPGADLSAVGRRRAGMVSTVAGSSCGRKCSGRSLARMGDPPARPRSWSGVMACEPRHPDHARAPGRRRSIPRLLTRPPYAHGDAATRDAIARPPRWIDTNCRSDTFDRRSDA